MSKRQYGLDVLRIIAIFLITAIHYLAYSQILSNPELANYNRIWLSLVSSMFVAAVNLFILITGYFSCEKKINFKRLFILWSEVVLVGVVLLAVGVLILRQPFKIATLIKTIFPFSTMHYWFFTMYVLLMIFSPIINLVISHLNEFQHKWICIIGFIVFSVFFVSNPFVDAQYYIAHARGIVWLSYLYIVGAGFKKYGWNLSKTKNIFSILLVYGLLIALQLFEVSEIGNCQLLDSNSVLPFLLSLLLFCLFKNIDINRAGLQKTISIFSSCSFLVYIVQEHDIIRNWYWNLFKINSYASSPFLLVNFLISIVLLWLVALVFQFLLDLIKPVIEFVYRKIESFVQKSINNWTKEG